MDELARAKIVLDQLLSNPAREIERLDVEIKGLEALNAKTEYGAKIAKAIMALGNHGGGTLVVGFRRPATTYEEDPESSEVLATWEKTRLHDLLGRFMDPVPEVDLSIEPGKLSSHPVLSVPSHGSRPFVCIRGNAVTRKGAVYIRKPGPKSEEPFGAEEWRDLIHRCVLARREEIGSMFRNILMPPSIAVFTEVGSKAPPIPVENQVKEADALFLQKLSSSSLASQEFGRWAIAYQVLPQARGITLRRLHSVLESAQGRETGWPIGVVMQREDLRPKTGPQMLEAWLLVQRRSAIDLDYWLAKPTGFFYHTRAFREDLRNGNKTPVLEWIRPVWVMGEGILHAMRFARGFGPAVDSIRFFARYQGLEGRVLWNSRIDIEGPFEEYTCHVDEWSREIEVPADLEVETLPDVVHSLLDPLYEQFDLFEMPRHVYNRELDKMLGRGR